MQRARHDVAVRGEPVRQRVVDAALVDVADGHGRAPRLPCHSGGEESDGAGADHERRRAGFGPPAVHGVDGDREGLQERGGGEADVVGESSPGVVVSKKLRVGCPGCVDRWCKGLTCGTTQLGG